MIVSIPAAHRDNGVAVAKSHNLKWRDIGLLHVTVIVAILDTTKLPCDILHTKNCCMNEFFVLYGLELGSYQATRTSQ
jgi:hypothetical protein